MQLLERYFLCLVSQYQKWELLCWLPAMRWQHLEAWCLVCEWGKVGSSPKTPRKLTAWELALRVMRSGICYLQSWSWFPRSPPSGCRPLRYSQASGQWLGQCSHSARGKWGQGIKKVIPRSQCLCVSTCFAHTKQKVTVSLVPPTAIHKTLFHQRCTLHKTRLTCSHSHSRDLAATHRIQEAF